MEDVENLMRTTIAEIEKVLSTRTVVGEPITIKDNIIIPLICIGFGFGVGAGSGKSEVKQKGEGTGGGGGAAVGIKPSAVIVIDKDGNIKIEAIKGGLASVFERWGESLPRVMEKCMDRCAQRWGKSEPPKEE